jgi:hypothetical protein
MLVCTYEDRATDLIGVRLLVSSLARHMPDVPVHVTCPVADDELGRWFAARPGVTFDKAAESSLEGWSVKAGLLLRLLEAGHPEVVWLDSDVIVAGDFRPRLPADGSLVATEELARNGPKENRLRTKLLGLPVGRALPHLVNSALLRVTPAHVPLLRAWIDVMKTDAYRLAQALPFEQRPIHFISDQDVLSALLGAQSFAHLPVTFLARGRDIIHDIRRGYAPAHRLINALRPMPPLVHAQGTKPWRFPEVPDPVRDPRAYYVFSLVESSPYSYVARQYRDELARFPAFLEVRSRAGRALGALARHNPHLHGLPLALVERGLGDLTHARHFAARALRLGRRVLGRARPG